MTDPTPCSRCGATDNRHSTKCLQAMALAWAMGVEERPKLGPVRLEDGLSAYAELERERVGASELEDEVSRLHAEMDLLGEKLIAAQNEAAREHEVALRWQRKYDQLAAQWDNGMVTVPVTQLPPGYHEDHVSAQRMAEIEREVAQLNESPDLEVVVHDELNATVTPKRDDDYTEAAVDETFDTDESYPDHGPEDDAAAAMGLPAKTTGTLDETPPAPETQPPAVVQPAPEAPTRSTDEWAAYVKELRARTGLSGVKFAKLVGCAAPSLGAWEKGQFTPGPHWQERLAEIEREHPAAALSPEEAKAADYRERGAKSNATVLEDVEGHVARFVEDLVDRTAPADSYLTSPQLLAAYDEWRKISGAPELTPRKLGLGLGALGIPKKQLQRKHVGAGPKPIAYWGVRWLADQPKADPTGDGEAPSVPLDPREQNKRDVEELRQLMKASTSRVEEIPAADQPVEHGPDELAIKLAQLKHFGIGGKEGVSKDAARTAVEDLHPTGNEIWTWSPPANVATGGKEVDDSELEATAYQLLVKCMDGLPEQYGYDYKEDVLATAGFVAEDVEAALRRPQRVEIRPESWDREKRYPVLGFHRGDVQVILGMRTPSKPRVIAAYWTSLLQADTYRVSRHGGGGSKKSTGLPTTTQASVSRLTGMGCEIEGDPLRDKTVKVLYKGQDLGRISCEKVTKIGIQSDYQRTLRKMQAIDRREEARVG